MALAGLAAPLFSPDGPEGVSPECVAIGRGLFAARRACGSIETTEGRILQCGSCDHDEVCGTAELDNVCCQPTTCSGRGADCGTMSDGCTGTLDCGKCPEGQHCGGAGVPNKCGNAECAPSTCAQHDFDCGAISDGCGGVLDCGSCPIGQICGGGGELNKCGFEISRPAEELVRGCFRQPGGVFDSANHAMWRIGVWAGARAPDFTLEDLDGRPHRLYELLRSRPVLLELGSYTCPVFQEHLGAVEKLAAEHGDRLSVVTVYSIEAHPAAPDPSPYFGRVDTHEFSKVGQPKTLDERRRHSRLLPASARRLYLVDELDNPVWCTYGPAPNPAFLIAQDGTVVAAHSWLHLPTMERSIEALLEAPRAPAASDL